MKKYSLIFFAYLLVAVFDKANAQNVGISNATGLTPQSLLHVHNTAIGRLLQLTNANTGNTATDGFQISIDGTSNIVFNQYEAAKMAFYTNNLERVTILSDGNVGIGTASPASKLDINGNLNVASGNGTRVTIGAPTSAGAAMLIGRFSGNPSIKSTDTYLMLEGGGANGIVGLNYYATGAVLMANGGGNVGIGTATPGQKLDVSGGSIRTTNQLISTVATGTAPLAVTSNTMVSNLNADLLDGYHASSFAQVANAYVQNGNAFGTLATLGTNDAYNLGFETDGTTRMTINTSGSVGIGITSPSSKLDISEVQQSEFHGSNSAFPIANLIIRGTGTSRTLGTGSAIEFVVPANTDGSNPWAQARILGTPDNSSNSNAEGALYLQTRASYDPGTGGSWNWRTNMVLRASGNVGIGTTSPGQKLDVSGGSIRTTNQLISTIGIGTAPIVVTSTTAVANLNADMLDGYHYNNLPYLTNANISGTTNYVSKFTGTNAIGISQIFDNSTNVGVGNASPTQKLDVSGNIKSTGYGIFPAGTALAASGATDGKIFSPSGDYLGQTNWGINYNEGAPDYIEFNNGGGPTSRIALDDGSAHFGLNGGKVGIGMTTPAETLDINGSLDWTTMYWDASENISMRGAGEFSFDFADGDGNDYWHVWDPTHSTILTVRNNGNVGIGTASPSTQLHTTGGVRFQTLTGTGNRFVMADASGNLSASSAPSANIVSGNGVATRVAFWSDANTLSSNANLYWDNSNSRLGIGTTSPAYKLDVNGPAGFNAIHKIGPPSNNPENGMWNVLWTAIAAGMPLYNDEEFAYGSNSVNVYNNSGGNGVLHFWESGDGSQPNTSGKWIRIVNNGDATSPGYGGFQQPINSRRNATFVQRFRAKLPAGYNLVIAENSQGSNATSYWLTPTAGTGKWEEYIRVSHCGNTGSFSSGGHVYVTGGSSATFTWYLGSCNVYEVGTPGNGSSNNNYIVNQASSDQSANFRISGSGYIAGNVGIGTTSPSEKLEIAGNIYLQNASTGRRDIRGTMADNDFWSIGANSTASNAGVLEIATGDDGQAAGGAEPIVVRQYGPGSPWSGTLVRTAYLLDAYGYSSFPGNVGIGTTSPGQKLVISGGNEDIIASGGGLRLGANNWSDAGSTYGHIITSNSGHNALMIVGNNVAGNSGHGREVKVWDYLNVQGSFSTTGRFYGVGTTDLVSNLNADLLDGLSAGSFMQYQGFTLDANTMTPNRSGFTYSVNAPFTGPIVHFDASNYGLQINSAYSSSGIAYRTRNGDNGTWNSWREFITTANIGSYGDNLGNHTAITTLNMAGNVISNIGEAYNNGWFRNNSSGIGMYNQATGNHFYSDGNYWNIAVTGSYAGLRLRDSYAGNVYGYFYGDGGGVGILNGSGNWAVLAGGSVNSTNTTLELKTNNTTRMYIDASGNVGIGITSPAEKLDVSGNIKSSSLAGTGNRPVYANASGVLKAGANDNTNWTLSANFSYSPDDLWGHGGTSGGSLSADDTYASYAMPFSLVIEGTSYSTLTISTNGWVAFGTVTSSYLFNSSLPTSTFSVPVICAYWDDIRPEGNYVRYGYVGTSPNRTVIIDYEAHTYSGDYDVRFQVQIHEGSGLINVKYRDAMSPYANGQSATIGFQLAGGSSAKAYPISYNGKVLDDNRDDAEGWSVCPLR